MNRAHLPERRPGRSSGYRFVALALAATCACASGVRRFPLRPPMWRDTDLESWRVACRPDPKPPKDQPGHQICRPEEYVSSFLWDGADNIVFRPIARFFAVDPGGEAVNVNAFDETPDSAWFTNRMGRHHLTHDELVNGACEGKPLDPNDPDGAWVIDSGKDNGANPGFRITLADGRRYLLKVDSREEPERATGATAIATRMYHAAGWNTACDSVVYARRSLLKLKPGLKVTDNHGHSRPFDQPALDQMLKDASKRGDLVRYVASQWVPGRAVGPFTYAETRPDDPADVIPHQDRRDLRGARLLAAWTDHFDSREQNSLDTWMSDDPKDLDASPGRVLHYYIDLGDCFGSAWPDPIWRRIGHSGYFDIDDVLRDFFTFGFPVRAWDRVSLRPGGYFGYYTADWFSPEGWKGGYPNPTFGRMTERDGAWAARIIARFSDADVADLVKTGDFTKPGEVAFLTEQLILRRDAILRRYLSRVSPITDVGVEPIGDDGGGELCGVDLARRPGLYPWFPFRYHAEARVGRALAAAPAAVRVEAHGRVCVSLPRVRVADGVRDDDPARYLIVDLANGQATGELHAHLYDLGQRGFRLVGVERDDGGSP